MGLYGEKKKVCLDFQALIDFFSLIMHLGERGRRGKRKKKKLSMQEIKYSHTYTQ